MRAIPKVNKYYMLSISVVVITYNEEKNLARCLASVAGIADEVIVVDSFSTDSTQQIVESFGGRFVSRVFDGYAKQKNYATGLAKNDWILSLDADEELSADLRSNIAAIKEHTSDVLFRIPRLTNYCGKWIKHCGWYPDLQGRLYNRKFGAWEEKMVHEFWKPAEESLEVSVLRGDLLHYSFSSIGEHMRKIEKYTELAAVEAQSRGRNASVLKVIFSPVWHFISEYFFKLGFLDGYYGFVICRLSAYSAFAKYSKIRQYSASRNV
jgi:glycosyltransferase involved in cell wall biosynthesis